MNRLIPFLAMLGYVLVLSGCGPKEQFVRSSTLTADESGTLILYRPDTFFHRWNPEEPIVYLDGERVGTLGVGETLTMEVGPGVHGVVLTRTIHERAG